MGINDVYEQIVLDIVTENSERITREMKQRCCHLPRPKKIEHMPDIICHAHISQEFNVDD